MDPTTVHWVIPAFNNCGASPVTNGISATETPCHPASASIARTATGGSPSTTEASRFRSSPVKLRRLAGKGSATTPPPIDVTGE